MVADAALIDTYDRPPVELPGRKPSPLERIRGRIGWKGAVIIEVAILIVLWEILISGFKVFPPSLFPAPSAVLVELVDFVTSGKFFKHLGFSAGNFVVGYLLAAVLGSTLGFLLGSFITLRGIVLPVLWIFYATPRLAMQPLLLLWLGFGNAPKILIIFLLAFFPIVFVVLEGVRDTDPALLRSARVYGTKGVAMYTKILLPAALPFVLVGLRLGIARGLVGVIIGEWIGGNQGLGYRLLLAGQEFRVDEILAITFILILIANVCMALLSAVRRRLAPWADEDA